MDRRVPHREPEVRPWREARGKGPGESLLPFDEWAEEPFVTNEGSGMVAERTAPSASTKRTLSMV